MANERRDYYADLGVSPSATVDEIKSIYRALVKIYHPDLNQDSAAVEKFKKITEAYQTLTDERRRAEYDGLSRDGQASSPEESEVRERPQASKAIEPVQCSHCSKVTAQPRFIVFRQVTSFITVTRSAPKAGIFCSSCASKVALKASAISAAFGWWGVPWGPIMTVGAIFRNAFGGERKSELDEELLWQNALAFLARGQPALSMSLARQSIGAKNNEIADAAKELVDVLSNSGVSGGRLKSTWAPNLRAMLGHFLMASAVPALVTLLFLLDSSSPLSKPSNLPPTRVATGSDFSPPSQPAKIINDLCLRRPPNNQILAGGGLLISEGHELTVRNGATGAAIVKVRNAITGRLLVSFYVAQSQSATIQGIPDGNYRIQFGYGSAMPASCDTFLDAHASEFDGIQQMHTEHRLDGIYTQALSFTLYSVKGGNISQDAISTSAFNAD